MNCLSVSVLAPVSSMVTSLAAGVGEVTIAHLPLNGVFSKRAKYLHASYMLDATRMALPCSLDRRGFTLKSNTISVTTRSMRFLELRTFCIVPHFFFSSSFCQSLRAFVF